MAENTVAALAKTLNVEVERLLSQMKEAGIGIVDAEAAVSAEDKKTLLDFLKKSHGQSTTQPKKIILKRKTTSTLKTTGSGGKSKTVNVEVRKKRTYVQRSVIDEQAAQEAEEKAAQEAAEKLQAEQEEAAAAEKLQAEQESEEAKAQAEQAAAELKAEQVAQEKAEQEAAKEDAKPQGSMSIAERAEQIKKEAAKRAVEAKVKKEVATKKKTPTAKKVKSTNSIIERAAKLEEEAKKRAAEANKTNQIDEAAKKAAEEKAAKETAKLAEKYKDAKLDTAPVVDDSPVHKSSIVQAAFEKSIQEEARTIKRGKDIKASKRRVAGSESISQDKTLKRSKFMNAHGFTAPTEKQLKIIEIGEIIKISDLAQKLSIKAKDLVKDLFKMGEMVTINDSIDHETAQVIVEDYGHQINVVSDTAIEDALADTISRDDENLQPRAPVVTIMGHVDHGKTSLLDYIRKAHVADGEAGGITQHIGAYHVETEKGMITFLDTPGHAAFTAMRARGAKATDIVIVVVAGDDGVMPQTKEAVEHSKAAGVPIIIAVNKMDKEEADIERVKSELAAIDVIPEDWGGEYQFMPVSAHSGLGVSELLETILLNAELLELKAHDTGAAEGIVIEARLEKGRGAVASILIQDGELAVGNMILAGDAYGRVRAMHDENGKTIKKAGPSIPVEILGLNGVPNAGDGFMIVKDERKAKEVAAFREAREREQRLARQKASKLENLFANMGKDEAASVNIVIKTDVRGSLEALLGALHELSTDEVRVEVVSSGVGGINESDVNLAMTSGAVILGFNVRADSSARKLCEAEGIDLRYYSIIYEMIDDVKAAMSGLLATEKREEIVGIAEVREVFRSSKFGTAAGCIVSEGTIFRNEPIRVLRDNVVIFEGELESLRRFKDDVNEVKKGIECGIGVKGYNDIKTGDLIEVFKITEIKRSL